MLLRAVGGGQRRGGTMTDEAPLHLFEGFGIELEYMLVDADDMSVRPMADVLLGQVGGGYECEVEMGAAAWSNELALHVVEMKTNGPAASLVGLHDLFQTQVRHINALIEPSGACLLPTAMHPFMNPYDELRLWPHENQLIYQTFDRIFDCRGHGWANLQSMHINLPFANDDELGRLHAAIRMVLPLVPGLAASSPFAEGVGGALDTRLKVYRDNARRVPSVSGCVVPERVFSRSEYQALLRGIYADLAPFDPAGTLQHEWVNARGCIARFDRMALEIRLVDVQEHPASDIAIAAALVAAVRGLVEEQHCSTESQRAWDERELAELLDAAVEDADEAVIDNAPFLQSFGFPERGRARQRELWQHLIETQLVGSPGYDAWEPSLALYVAEGTLARRIVTAAGSAPSRARLVEVYRRLADCLAQGQPFRGAA